MRGKIKRTIDEAEVEESNSDDSTTAQPGGEARVNFTGRRVLIDYCDKKMWEVQHNPQCSACGNVITIEEDYLICNHCFKG